MLSPANCFRYLKDAGVNFFAGVPDSLLKSFCAFVTANSTAKDHVITANEGAAVGMAMGHHLATGEVPLVYMQNSGLGNIINPLLSLVDKEVYAIPMLLMIGWRGEPGKKDEPQHVKQGRVTLSMLDAMEIPYSILGTDDEKAKASIAEAVATAKASSSAYAIVVAKDTFDAYTLSDEPLADFGAVREDAVKYIIDALDARDIVVSTTGMTSREVFEYREALGHDHSRDFLTVGGMGHASQIALGVAKNHPQRRVVCIDGDGAVLMHMGSMAINGMSGFGNFNHIVINNGAHDSVGGQPTLGFAIDIPAVARACGYSHVGSCEGLAEFGAALSRLFACEGVSFLEVKVNKGSRKDLGRPTTTPVENRDAFAAFVRS